MFTLFLSIQFATRLYFVISYKKETKKNIKIRITLYFSLLQPLSNKYMSERMDITYPLFFASHKVK